MTSKTAQEILNVIENQKPDVAVAMIEQIAGEATAAAKPARKGVTVPSESPYEFKTGEQVCLFNPKRDEKTRFRTHYEYVRRGTAHHVVKNVKDGTEHRLWLNKLMPMSVAKKHMKALEMSEKAAAKSA